MNNNWKESGGKCTVDILNNFPDIFLRGKPWKFSNESHPLGHESNLIFPDRGTGMRTTQSQSNLLKSNLKR
jgi:hypothetical protein